MRVLAVAISLVGMISLNLTASAATTAPLSVLPSHAHLVASERIPDVPDAEAVIFTDGGSYVGVITYAPGAYRLLWTHELPEPGEFVAVSGIAGLFGGIAHKSGAEAGAFFAFRFEHGVVRSAVGRHVEGIVSAAEGARFSDGEFVVRRHDLKHDGSIAYQLVTRFTLDNGLLSALPPTRRPDYATGQLPSPRAEVTTSVGDTILLRLEVANTESLRESGLMYIKQLDTDTGMIFVWDQPVRESFWMENTLIPLSIAFLGPDGTVHEIQDMAAETTDLHTPQADYQYAIEANLGYFAANGIKVGDRLQLQLTTR